MIKTVGIIGLGKFSELMINYLKEANPSLVIKVSSRSKPIDNKLIFSLDDICKCDLVIPAVPMINFKETIELIAPKLNDKSIVMDICSVKVHPKRVMLKYLDESVQIICTHPNFGPESFRMNGNKTNGLNYIVENVRASDEVWDWFMGLLKSLEFNIIEMSAEEHDKNVGIPHFSSMFIGLLLSKTDMKRIEIGAASTQKMFDMVEGVGKDIGILRDMYVLNPFAKDHMRKLEENIGEIKKEIF